MPKKAGNVQTEGSFLTLEQQRELCGALVQAAPTDMPRNIYEAWMKKRSGLNRAIRQALLPSLNPVALPVFQHDEDTLCQLESWEQHYRDEYQMRLDFSGILIPIRRVWTKRLIVVAQGMLCNRVFVKCLSLFLSWAWTSDLDTAVKGINEREPIRSYAIWVRGDREPDDIAMTADQTRTIGLSGTTLLEDLLMEPKYFKETGEHLNVEKVTRCDGSRYSDGYVPGVIWYDSKFKVVCCNPDYPSGNLRPRVAVS